MVDDLRIRPDFTVPAYALGFTAVKSSGPGGQHVNTTNSAVQLRVDLNSFYVPDHHRRRIARYSDSRLTRDGHVVIKAGTHRSQSRNRKEALERLRELLVEATEPPVRRKRTRASRSSKRRAIRADQHRRRIKALRKTPEVPRG